MSSFLNLFWNETQDIVRKSDTYQQNEKAVSIVKQISYNFVLQI